MPPGVGCWDKATSEGRVGWVGRFVGSIVDGGTSQRRLYQVLCCRNEGGTEGLSLEKQRERRER